MNETDLPLTIDSGHGEIIIFTEVKDEPEGAKVILEGHVQPNCGPALHVHHKQDEYFHVVQGTMAYEVPGKETAYLYPGDSTTFSRDTPHKFWNNGEVELILHCWAQPANNLVFYLTTLYAATNGQKTPKPDAFDLAYLDVKYKSEYSILELPWFVKKIIMPLTYYLGWFLGKYKKFKNAPNPIK